MSTSGQDPSGGERDPPQMPRKKRGPTTGVVSARARVGTPGANTVRYDQNAQAFYQDVREQNPLIGTFQNRLGNLIKSTIPVDLPDWNHVPAQSVAALMNSIHNEYNFVYEHPESGELVPADPIRNEIDMAIIRDAKRMRRGQKSRLSQLFFKTFCGSKDLAKNETPEGYNKEAWLKAIETFDSPEHKV